MTPTQAQFEEKLNKLSEIYPMQSDYWLSVLTDDDGELLPEKLTDNNYALLSEDVTLALISLW